MRSTIRRPASGLYRLAAGTALATALIAGATAQATADPMMSDLEIARQALAGATVQSVELDTADGTPQWEVDIRTRDGAVYEVQVDANTGTVLSIEPDQT
ncbi:PepSY domain-containing protein [Nocardia iowensis]|uniref:PepSY domain-containing protein n=1 Tax=Nocardia iowensis TaxID=204891 RepID=A0ABX8RU02_NOCIO|nr:PepSY domain-containing protein [Nocardia iowensis]QXN92372.1 PepSY domain-containing protein [Nocardia iowensis]